RGACHRAGHFGPDPLARNDKDSYAGELTAENSLAGIEKSLRINGFAFDANFIMQMRSGRTAGRAEFADGLAAAYRIADIDIYLGQMPIAGGDAVTVIDL